jgi:hypothetical protein
LRALGVRTDTIRQLADRPAAQVMRVIEQARTQTGVRNIAAWVVSALRALPVDVVAPAPRHISDTPIVLHQGISGRERQIWLARFRAADLADRQSILDHFLQEFAHVSAG